MEGILDVITTDRRFDGYTFRIVPPPRTDRDEVIRFRTLCAENTCGQYGTSWGCPPGSCSVEDAVGTLERYSEALVAYRSFDVPDNAGKSFYDPVQKDHQDVCRELAKLIRKRYGDAVALGDGGCTYCKRCAYPDPCRSPENRVPSVSGLGIDMERYMKSQDIPFAFEKGRMTLYGIILFNQ